MFDLRQMLEELEDQRGARGAQDSGGYSKVGTCIVCGSFGKVCRGCGHCDECHHISLTKYIKELGAGGQSLAVSVEKIMKRYGGATPDQKEIAYIMWFRLVSESLVKGRLSLEKLEVQLSKYGNK